MRTNAPGRPKSVRIALAAALTVLGVLPSASPASATSWTVCASGCTFSTITAALASSTVSSGDTLQLTDAAYGENNLTITKSLTLAGSGTTPAIGKSSPAAPVFVVTGAINVTFQNLIVQNGVSNSSAVAGGITSQGATTSVTLDQVLVRNNRSAAAGAATGGGVHAGGPLTITNSTIFSNSVASGVASDAGQSAQGAGVWSSGQTLFISNSQILSNTAIAANATPGTTKNGGAASGGGLYFDSTATTPQLTISSSTVASNTVVGGEGGGGDLSSGGNAAGAGIAVAASSGNAPLFSMDRTVLRGNSVRAGGPGPIVPGAFVFSGQAGGGGGDFSRPVLATISRSIVQSNIATGAPGSSAAVEGAPGSDGGIAAGGGLRLQDNAVIDSSAIIGNQATGGFGGFGAGSTSGNGGDGGRGARAWGGGIYAAGALTVTNSTLAQNTATSGFGGTGGFAIASGTHSGRGGDAAEPLGGGIFLFDSLGAPGVPVASAQIQSSTIYSNTAFSQPPGAAGPAAGFASGNASGLPGSSYGGGVETKNVSALMRANVFSKNVAVTGPDVDGTLTTQGGNVFQTAPSGATGPGDKIKTDPLLQPVSDNGGNTLTSALGPNSPAIGFAGSLPCPALDQRGQPRRANYCDSGAFAVQPDLLQGSAPPQSTQVGTFFPTPLSVVPTFAGSVLTNAIVTFAGPSTGPGATFGGATSGGVPAVNGVAQVSPQANDIRGGPYNATASAGTAAPLSFSLTNLGRPTTTTVSASPNPSGTGVSVSATIAVTANGGTPTGTVTVSADTGESCQVVLPATSCAIAFQTSGARTISASYPGDASHLPSSGNTSHTVAGGGGGGGGGSQVVYIGAAFASASTTF